MNKLNKEIVLKLVILAGFILSFSYFIKNDLLKLYIHPRYIILVKFTVVILSIMFLFTLCGLFSKAITKKSKRTYLLFIIPFFMIVSMNSSTVTESVKNESDINIAKGNDNVNPQDKVYEDYLKDREKKKSVIEEDGKITVNDDNYAMFLSDINTKMSSFENKEVEIIGFVYRDDSMKDNTFALVRYMMVCCIADMDLVGVLCESNDARNYEDNTWIKVNGKLVLDKDLNELKIAIENIEKINKPDREYIYRNIN